MFKTCFHRHLQKDHQWQPIQTLRKHVCKICSQTLFLFDQNSQFDENQALIKDHYLKMHFPLHSTAAQPPITCIYEDCQIVWTSRAKMSRCFRTHRNHPYPFELEFPSLANDNNNDNQQNNDNDHNQDDDNDDDHEGNQTENPSSSNDQLLVEILQPPDCSENFGDMNMVLGSLYGSLKYVFRVQNSGIDSVAKSLKNIGLLTHKNINSTLQSCAQKNNIDPNNPFLLDLKKEMGKMFAEFSLENSYGSVYRRLKTFDHNEDVIQPVEIYMDKVFRKKHKIVMFDMVALIERFLKSKDIASIWESAKKDREQNDHFNLQCLANNQLDQVRYLSLYDGRRIKEKLATLEANVFGIVMTFYLDDYNIDQGYTHKASNNKILGKKKKKNKKYLT